MYTSTLVGGDACITLGYAGGRAIHPSQSPWCNAMVLVRKKDDTLHFCVDFRCLSAQMKKDSYHLPHIQEVLESIVGQHISHQCISSQASGKSRWHRSCSNTQPSQWVTSGSMSSPTCHSGCVMPRDFSASNAKYLG